ncbi:glycoside hydrolase family 97 protein [Candidatus Saccharibacteria bacterium]|nr:glycoside hydrolase family 97 protein [Candidatus Saccharibacteria bacterium]
MLKLKNLFPSYSFKKDVYSPDRNIKCQFELKNHQISYSVYKNQIEVIKRSKLGIEICGEHSFPFHPKIVRVQEKQHRETIEMLWGEDRFINNNYSEAAFYIAEDSTNGRMITLRFRVFDDSVAFRYEIPPQPKFRQITIKKENTEFNLDLDDKVWKIPAYQADRYEYNYEKSQVKDLTESVHTPLTVHTTANIYLCIHEAALYNYGSMNLKLNQKQKLCSDITPLSDRTAAHVILPFNTPWRLIMLADSAIELTKNRTMYALNDPPKKDFSWVKTIKFIGIWWAMYVGEWTWTPGENHGATTEHAKAYIESAVRLGISGLLIEGWNNGWEGDWLENGEHNSFTEPSSDFNLEEVSSYAKKHRIEIIGHHETVGFVDNYENQLSSAYDYYAKNGIHYVKTGYSGSMMKIRGRNEFHHSQLGVNHYQKTVELAAKKHICLDIHEPIKGTGIERTWPNLLSREGARGQEYESGAILPSHTCYLPYTRLLSGGMDYTSGIFDLQNSKRKIYTTLAKQLAYYVVIYSGMQMAADRPFIYEDKFKKEFQFIKNIPTNFAKTIPLSGEIGEYYIVARKDRYSSDWYIGGVTNEKSREVTIDISFLDEEVYNAEFYTDSKKAHYRTNPFGIEINHKKINRKTPLNIYLAPGGGFAIRLTKINAK